MEGGLGSPLPPPLPLWLHLIRKLLICVALPNLMSCKTTLLGVLVTWGPPHSNLSGDTCSFRVKMSELNHYKKGKPLTCVALPNLMSCVTALLVTWGPPRSDLSGDTCSSRVRTSVSCLTR